MVNSLMQQQDASLNFQCRQLSFGFRKDKRFFDSMSFSLPKGKMSAILGPNGSGKTTLIKLLVGLYKPFSGTFIFQNQIISALTGKERAKIISYVPQKLFLHFDISVDNFLISSFMSHQKGLSLRSTSYHSLPIEDKNKFDHCLFLFELEEFKNRSFKTLSGGEQQRLLLASAFLQDAPIIVLDEPFSSLDVSYQEKTLYFLKLLSSDKGKTIIFSVHDLNQAINFSSYCILLRSGKLISEGTTVETLNSSILEKVYSHQFIIQKLNEPDIDYKQFIIPKSSLKPPNL